MTRRKRVSDPLEPSRPAVLSPRPSGGRPTRASRRRSGGLAHAGRTLIWHPPADFTPPRDGASGRPVLVIDDDVYGREALSRLLEQAGFRTLRAADGGEALTNLASGPRPGLILLDLVMPRMDGWQFRARQCGDPLLADIPVIVVSAVPVLRECNRLVGVVGLFEKPVPVAELLAAVRKHYQGV